MPGLLIKHVVYEEFWICESTGSGLLIKPVVYEEFDVPQKQKKVSCVFYFSRSRIQLIRDFLTRKVLFDSEKFLFDFSRFDWKNFSIGKSYF